MPTSDQIALIKKFKNAGGGHLDLMTCETVLAQLGKELR